MSEPVDNRLPRAPNLAQPWGFQGPNRTPVRGRIQGTKQAPDRVIGVPLVEGSDRTTLVEKESG